MAGMLLPPCGLGGEVPAVMWIKGCGLSTRTQDPGSRLLPCAVDADSPLDQALFQSCPLKSSSSPEQCDAGRSPWAALPVRVGSPER